MPCNRERPIEFYVHGENTRSESPGSCLCIRIFKTGLQLRVHDQNLIFLFLNQNVCGGYSKEPSQRD